MKKGMWFYVTSDGFDVDFTREHTSDPSVGMKTSGIDAFPESSHPMFLFLSSINRVIQEEGEVVTPSEDGKGPSTP